MMDRRVREAGEYDRTDPTHQGDKDTITFGHLTLSTEGNEHGIEYGLARNDATGRQWRVRSAPRGSAAAAALDREARVTRQLPEHLVEVPRRLEHRDHVILLYPDHTATTLADLPADTLTLERFLDVAAATAEALSRLHGLGVVHGGLRPSSVLVEDEGRIRFRHFAGTVASQADPQAGAAVLSPATMAYAAPEQARIHRPACDVRSDLYALGVVLYERLVGRLPLSGGNVAEWLHAHVAVDVVKPSAVRGDVPAVVDDILLKLVAKDPGHRYQSAESLQADLRLARAALAETGGMASFALGRGDLAPRAQVSRRLFGRTSELADLVGAFERVRKSGESELVLISGEAGAGKSALVEQLSKVWLAADVHFAAGKSDLLQKGIPYAPFVQALRTLIMRLLSENTAVLEATRARLAAALAGYSRLLIDLVPEAEFVLSEAGPLPDVTATLAQARIARVILQTVTAVATPQTPLVLFLDDLQWLDAASFGTLRAFLNEPPPHVLLIGSYREEERAQQPELRGLLEEARGGRTPVSEISLRPLSSADAAEFVSIALNSSPADVGALAESIYRKTQGNAFYIGQLLQKLVDDKVVTFDPERQRWNWDRLRLGAYDSVSEFMLQRLDALKPDQRALLRRLACAGGRCPAELFLRLLGQDPAEVEAVAAPLLESGLLLRRETDYLIAHDRVLEAAYALTAEDERPAEHLSVARRLIEMHGDANADWAFSIAAQIERADREALGEAERLSFVRVLRMAARRARNAGAVPQAAGYLVIARDMMEPGWRESHHALFVEVEWLYCDSLLALAKIDEALVAIDRLLALAVRPVDRADTFRLKAIAHTVQSDYERAIDAALAGLALLGVDLERSPNAEQLDLAYRACRARLDGVAMRELRALPEMTDPSMRSALALLPTLAASFFVESGLRFLHLIRIVELTLEHGTTPESAYGLAWFGVFSAHHYGAYEDGATYALAAHDMVQRDGYEAQRTATLVALDQIIAWTRPLGFALAQAREAAQVGRAAGDLGMACYARNHIASDLLMLGAPLAATRGEIEEGLAWTRQFQYRDIEYILDAQLRLVNTLVSGEYDRENVVPEDQIASIPTRFWVHHYAGLTAFMFGDTEKAVAHLEKGMRLTWSAPAHIDAASCAMFFVLALARSSQAVAAPETVLARVADLRQRFADWARLNPLTFECKHLLLEAEAARLSGARTAAQSLYERAADAAAAAGFVHEQALAYELAGYCYQEMGLEIPTEGYMRAAIRHYRHWGAEGKVAQMVRCFPLLALGQDVPRPSEEGQGELNLAVMTKAAQTLAEEVGLEQVIRTLMRDMIIHAGAQYGLLLLMRGEDPVIEASARIEDQQVKVDVHTSLPTARDLPLPVLNTVMRTRKTVVFADAFSEAPRLRLGGPDAPLVRSLLCMPLIKRGALVGILYLENSLAADIFTPNRTAMLELLAPQAAISLDAARLYKDLLDENTRRASAEFALREARAELGRTSRMTAMGGYAASIAHEINQPLTSIVASADATVRWLRRPQPDLQEALQGLEQIRAAGMRAAGIVKSLRSLSKQAPPAFETVRLEDLVEDVLRLIAKDLEAHGIELVDRLAVERRPVRADPVQLQQVVFNLITNAIHAMDETEAARRRLRVETSIEAGAVRLDIGDAGCGMTPEVLSHIFQPFFTTKHSGMGIGLSICRSIIDAHGGTLEARSTTGEGSTFFFSLALAE
ncbi:trifunctional serine/threonine-protein kinase/ATP-binding protein/sensor histidine kinase [Xanthobacter autotrophicus]|uniref:trifunctional serine/threonine-protein kinase/ATP-binding protein/sensor histidine kinase n=1 Tax=Xanthobacter autotrophicus TaxID=280 RepID=UPI00372C01FF